MARDLRRWRLGLTVVYKFEPDEETRTTHVADLDVAVADLTEPIHEVAANSESIFDQPLVADRIKYGKTRGGGNRIASEGVEVLCFCREPIEQYRARRNAPHGKAVTHRLAHGHDIGHDAVPCKTPQRGAGPAKPGLHLVADACHLDYRARQ